MWERKVESPGRSSGHSMMEGRWRKEEMESHNRQERDEGHRREKGLSGVVLGRQECRVDVGRQWRVRKEERECKE